MQTQNPIQISDILDEIARGSSLDHSLDLIAQKARDDLRAPSCKIWVVKHGDICEHCPLATVCTNRQMCLHLASVSGSAMEKEYPRIPISILNTSLIVRGGIADFTDGYGAGEKLFGAQHQESPDTANAYALFPLRGISGTVGLIGIFNNRAIAKEELQTLAQLSPAAVAAIRVAELQSRCDALRDQLEKGAALARQSSANESSEEQFQELQTQHEALKMEFSEKQDEALLLKAELAARQNELTGMRESVRQLEEKASLLEETNAELREYNVFLVEKVENLQDSLAPPVESPMKVDHEPEEVPEEGKLKGELEHLQRAHQQLSEQQEQFAEEGERLRKEGDRLQDEKSQLARENIELAEVNEELSERSKLAQARLLEMERENADLQEANTQLEDALKQLEALVPKLEESVDHLSSRTEVSERLCTEMDERNRALTDEIKRLASRAQINAKLIANVSHELRHPINSILGFASLMLDDPSLSLPEKQRHNLERIADNARDLSELINQILDYSKIEAGRMEVYAEPVALQEVIKKATDIAEGLQGNRPIRLQAELAEQLPLLCTDRAKLQQILINLLSNALKFTDAGEVKITASLADDRHIRLAVSDTGIGISESDIPKIFAEFYQANHGNRPEKPGSGLGLAITHRLVNLLKGEIEVFSKIGEGSIFIVTLPVKIESSEAPLADTPALDPERTALLISREAATLYLVKKYLTQSGYSVATADELARGLEIVSMAKPWFILVDMDGLDNSVSALRQIADHSETGKVLAFSIDRNVEWQALQSGAEGFLTKPIEKEELLAALGDRKTPAPDYVLVVDDDADTVEIVKGMLESSDYNVKSAANGRAAMNAVIEQKPKAIVLDLMLPEMDGFEVAHRLHLNPLWREIPIVLLTARDLSNEERAVLLSPATRILQKGNFTRDELLGELDKLVNAGQNINRKP
jgi:signal transduction histidine kinase/DNA-binding response OmpR family regulator